MMNSYDEFFKDDPWDRIEIGAFPSTARRLYKEDSRFWVSVNSEGNALFFMEEEGHFDIEAINRLDCLHIQIEHLASKTRLVCELTEQEMFDKFKTIAKDVASFSSGFEKLSFFRAVISRIYSWSEFLKPSRSGIGFRELIGFWGELYAFKTSFVEVLGFPDALKAWVGPENKKQDFTLGSCAFETKTRIVGDNNNLAISSIEQLQKVTDELYLVVERINESDKQSGLTINQLVEDCLKAIDTNELVKADFLHKIASQFGKATEEELNRSFTHLHTLIYVISDEFPKIVPENLPHEKILKAKYVIDGNSLESYLESKSLKELIEHGTSTSI